MSNIPVPRNTRVGIKTKGLNPFLRRLMLHAITAGPEAANRLGKQLGAYAYRVQKLQARQERNAHNQKDIGAGAAARRLRQHERASHTYCGDGWGWTAIGERRCESFGFPNPHAAKPAPGTPQPLAHRQRFTLRQPA